MAKAVFKVKYNDRELRHNIENFDDIVDKMLDRVVEYHAARGQSEMKMSAPWTDRTSAARNGLFTVVEKEGKGSYTIVFSHTVNYGIWLEVKFSGRDAVIMPTIQKIGVDLMEDIRRRI